MMEKLGYMLEHKFVLGMSEVLINMPKVEFMW